MKYLRLIILFTLLQPATAVGDAPEAGFFIPENTKEVTMNYQSIDNLVILAVTINDSIHVNLILDTGCRNVVLFGKKFLSLFQMEKNRKVMFSGPGSGSHVEGNLSLGNRITIGEITGNRMPVVLVKEKNLFSQYSNIHGVIGYDVFTKFEVELNFFRHQVTFRPGDDARLSPGFTSLPFHVNDTRPHVKSTFQIDGETFEYDLLIDTGSTLGLLITTNESAKLEGTRHTTLGRGLNGFITGAAKKAKALMMGSMPVTDVPVAITYSPLHSYASLGVGVLQNYTLVLNYSRGYAGLRKETA